jgi:hypothetical protein
VAKSNKGVIGSGRRAVSFSTWQILLVGVVFGALGLYALMTTFAASPRPSATLVANPNPATVGSSIVFTGCGFAPNTGTTVAVRGPYATSFFGGPTDAEGCFDSSKTENFDVQQVGVYTATAYQDSNKGKSRKSTAMASVTLIVQ